MTQPLESWGHGFGAVALKILKSNCSQWGHLGVAKVIPPLNQISHLLLIWTEKPNQVVGLAVYRVLLLYFSAFFLQNQTVVGCWHSEENSMSVSAFSKSGKKL